MNKFLLLTFVLICVSCSSDVDLNNSLDEKDHQIQKRLCIGNGTIEDPADRFEDYFSFDENCDLVTNFTVENVIWSVELYNSTGTNQFASTNGYQFGHGSLDIASSSWNGVLAYVCISSHVNPGNESTLICCEWYSVPDCGCVGCLIPEEPESSYELTPCC